MNTLTKPAQRTTDHLHQTVAALARLLDQAMNDIRILDSEFEASAVVRERLQARCDEEIAAAVEAARAEQSAGQEQLSGEFERLRQAARDWEMQRAQLVADCERANQLLEQTGDEYQRALAETGEAAAIALERQTATAIDHARAELAAQWEAERTELIAQRDRAIQTLAGRDAEHHQALAIVDRVRSELTDDRDRLQERLAQEIQTSARWESECNRLRHESAAQKRSPAADALHAEIARVEGLIHGISQVIEDRSTELSVVIRKSAERAELESYLRGVRFRILE